MDLFSVPLGHVDADQGAEDELSASPVPPEAFDHRGKWVALRRGKVVAVKKTRDELGDRGPEVSFFHVPATRVIAR